MRIILMVNEINFKDLCDECGALVTGTSEKHLKANIILHKRGKDHKAIMKFKKNKEGVIESRNNIQIANCK